MSYLMLLLTTPSPLCVLIGAQLEPQGTCSCVWRARHAPLRLGLLSSLSIRVTCAGMVVLGQLVEGNL
jgi:hypothetical protein